MKKKLFNVLVVSIALLLLLGTGLQGSGLASASQEEIDPPAGDPDSLPVDPEGEPDESGGEDPLLEVFLQARQDGEAIHYTITLENSVDLTDLAVEDSLSGPLADIPALAAGEGWSYDYTFDLPEDFGDARITNSVFVGGHYEGQPLGAETSATLELASDDDGRGQQAPAGNQPDPEYDEPNPDSDPDDPGLLIPGGDDPDEFSSNPDGLEYPVEIPAPDLYYPSAPLLRPFAPMSLLGGSMGMLSGGYPDEINNIAWDQPGSLQLNKTAEPVEGTTNQWKVTLTLEGKDKEVATTSDIVLVIDRSGSMEGTRMTEAKKAAKNFVNTLLNDPNDTSTRIAVVSFAGDVTAHNAPNYFCNASEKDALLEAINGLNASGGTFTQAGLRQARILLGDSEAIYKNIVLLSDGEPTYSYSINNIEYNTTDFFEVGTRTYYTKDDFPESRFDYGSTKGDGTSMTYQVHSTGLFLKTRYYYHHGNIAIAESSFTKDYYGITIYTVGLVPGADGQDVLDRIASPGKSYAATEANLTKIFNEIAGDISETAAARNATVTDPLNKQWFSIPGITNANYASLIHVSNGEITGYDEETGTITWEIPFVKEGTPVSMWYIVQINDSAVGGELYDTNLATYVDYTNINDQDAKKYFPIPKAGIEATGTIIVTKQMESGGSTNKKFAIYVEKQGGGGRWSMLLADGDSATITGLGTGTYTIREVVPMGYKLDKIKVGSVEGTTVIFTTENLNDEVNVTVTNKKGKGGWFRDDDEKVNIFKLALSF